MGKGMKSLMAAAHAAGYAMAAEDIYHYEDAVEEHAVARPVTTALVPVSTSGIEMNIMAQSRTLARKLTTRYLGSGWLMPRLTA